MKKLLMVLTLICLVVSVSACSKKNDLSNKTLEDIENYLLDEGVLAGEKTETLAILIGAMEGFKYPDSNIEIYKYDMDSDVYKSILKNGKVDLSGLGSLAVNAVNGPFVLISSGEIKNEDDVISTFKDFK